MSAEGTPAVVLGFTRAELDAIEQQAWPDSNEAWLHGLVTAALDGTIVYKYRWPTEPGGDANRVNGE